MPRQPSPDLTLPLAQPITLMHLVTLMDAAILIRELDQFRQARPVWGSRGGNDFASSNHEETRECGRMRSRVLTGLVCCAALAGCFDSSPKLSKEDEQLFDAVMYTFTGIEDNTKDSYGLTPWHRNAKPKAFEYWKIGKNGIGSSDDETNRKIRNSRYVRYVYRLSNPEPCVFRFEDITEFSKGESQEDFSVYSMTDMLNSETFYFANAHSFEFVDNGWGNFIIVLEGPRVACSEEGGYCENKWTSALSGMAYTRFDDDQEAVRRRGRAIELIKKACPGKAF